jgi:hypothetical protein
VWEGIESRGMGFWRRNHPALRAPPELFGTGSPEDGNLRSLACLGGEFSLDGLRGNFPWMLFCVLTLWLIVAGTDYIHVIEFIKLLLFLLRFVVVRLGKLGGKYRNGQTSSINLSFRRRRNHICCSRLLLKFVAHVM